MLAIHPSHVAFSAESRSFVLLSLLLSVAVWMAWRWLERATPRDGVGYLLAATAALYTHYLSAIVLACLFLWGVVTLARDRARFAAWIGLQLAVIALFAPQLALLRRQAARLHEDHWVKPTTLAHLFDFVRQLGFGANYLVPVVLVLALVPLARRETHRAAALLLATTVVPVALCWVLSLRSGGLFIERAYFVLPSFALLVGAGSPRSARTDPLGRDRHSRRSGCALLLRPAHAEGVAPGRSGALARGARRAADVVVHGEAHACCSSATTRCAGEPALMARDHLPYYDGDLIIPTAWRVDTTNWLAAMPKGRTWWALANPYSGIDLAAARRQFAASGADTVVRFGEVLIWRCP